METANRHGRRRVETLKRRGLSEQEIDATPDKHSGIVPASLAVGLPFKNFSGVSRSTQYRLIAEGELRSFLIGARRYIEIASWHELMKRRLTLDDALRAAGERLKIAGCTSRWDDRPYVS